MLAIKLIERAQRSIPIPPKISPNQKFSDVFRGYRNGTLALNRLIMFFCYLFGNFEHVQPASLVFLCSNVIMLLSGGLLGKRVMLYILQSIKLKLGKFCGKISQVEYPRYELFICIIKINKMNFFVSKYFEYNYLYYYVFFIFK